MRLLFHGSLAVSLLAGCGAGPALTIHNGTDEAVVVQGLPGQAALRVEAGTSERVEGLSALPALVARSPDGRELGRVPGTPLVRGGEAAWSIGGTGCFAEADYGSYYAAIEVPAAVELLGANRPGEPLYVSKGAVDAGPGRRLPARSRGRAVALVQVPCAATKAGDAVLRSWLEVKLREIEPAG